LWIVQAVLSLIFIGTGLWKLLTPVPRLAAMIPWAGQVSEAFLHATAVIDLCGGVGVLLPALTVALGFVLARKARRAELLFGWTLGLVTVLIGLATIAVPGWATSFADGRSRLVDLAAGPFAADFARLLPSVLRPRPAAWIVPSVAIAALWIASRDRRRRLRLPQLAATSCIFALFAAGVVAANRLPTRIAEAEDPWVARGNGTAYPDPWTVDRTLYAGGLSLPAGERALELHPVPGGERVTIRLVYRAHPDLGGASILVVSSSSAGELRRRALGAATGWITETLPERAWAGDERLLIEVIPADPTRLDAAVIVDRMELAWR
jgi:hypothetical protein